MKLRFSFLLSYFIIFSSLIYAGTQYTDIESEARQLAHELLDGKIITIRIYKTGDNASYEYETAHIQLNGFEFAHKDIKQLIPEIDSSNLIVVTGTDQADKAIKTILDKYISYENYKDSKIQSVWPDMSNIAKYQDVVFCDALGNPITEAMVEIRINLTPIRGRGINKISEETLYYDFLDDEGKYKLPVWTNAQTGVAYIISHPNYGKVLVQSRGTLNNNKLILPVVPLDSEAASRSFQGFVLDDNSDPVQSLIIHISAMNDTGDVIRYSHTVGVAITDANGFYNVYPPLESDGELYTEPAPANTKYNMFIRPDTSMNLQSYQSICYRNEYQIGSEPKKIILRRMNPNQYFHTLSFIDERGEITDKKELEKISIDVLRDNRTWQTLKYDQFKNGCYFNLGTLNVSMMRGNKMLRFSEIELTEESPEEIVLVTGQEQIYSGMVIDALTGQPVPNVLVLGESGARRDEDYAKLKEQAGELRLRALSEIEKGLSNDQLFETEMRLALTDKHGRYQFIFRRGYRGNLEYFNVIDENYHTRRMYLFEEEQSEAAEGVFNVKTIELRPQPNVKQPLVFVFLDEFGQEITDPEILNEIYINVQQSENASKGGKYESMIPKSMYWDYGTYSANLNYGGYYYVYEPVIINENSPEVVVFKIKQDEFDEIIVSGRVINGITNEPMPNVVVYTYDLMTVLINSMSQSEVAKIIDSFEDKIGYESQDIGELAEALNAATLTITDKDGFYKLPVQKRIINSGPTSSIMAVKKDYMGARRSLKSILSDNENSNVSDIDNTRNLPNMEMFPSGQVQLELNLPDMTSNNQNRMRVIYQYRTAPGDTTFLTKRYQEMSSNMIRTNEIWPNGKQIITIPAGIEYSLIMYTLFNQTGGVTLRGIKLEQGETIDLGLIEFPETYKVNVKVTDSQGNPVYKAPVKCLDEFGLYRGQHAETSLNGIVSVYVTPNSRGRFVVACQDQITKENMHESLFYEVRGQEDAEKEFLFQLSDEIIQNLSP